jgi:K+-transporting ATPase ATPase C chain
MAKQLRASITAFIILTAGLGLLYPLLMTGLAQALFPKQANGSLIVADGKPVGSELIGQYFSDPKYFWGRPSATGPVPYTSFNADKGTGSGGSNYGPLNPALIGDGSDSNPSGLVKTAIDALRAADPDNKALIPVDLVTASASGLDPDISPAAAKYQAHRVAKARGLTDAAVQQLVDQYTSGRMLGFLGEPHVNVLMLNLALDSMADQTTPQAATPAPTAAATSAR